MLPRSFQTNRLIARLPVPGDSAHLFAAYTSKPEVSRFMIWQPHAEVATTEVFVAECIAAAGAGSRFPYVLAWRENPGIPIGMLEARPSDFKVEIGYVLAPEYWGQGLMPEAVSSLADLMLDQAEFFRIQAFCDVDNVPSQRMLEKAGFLREGRHERFMIHPNLSAEPRPCYMYAKCK